MAYRIKLTICLAALAGILAISSRGILPAAKAQQDQVNFNRDIEPIFAANCYQCHSAKKASSQLRLDAKTAAMKGGLSGIVIVPGNSKDSRLVHRILGLNDEARMPMGGQLKPEQIELIKRWIDEGAAWPEDQSASRNSQSAIPRHWAFVTPTRAALPEVKNAAWPRTPVDRFILAGIEKQGLTPSPEASRETLIRRLSLDLTGLPLTLKEIDEFLADRSPQAYEKLADRLLASPHYGERWGRWWLDAARYADSNGYSIDAPRQIWKYRDWVVAALNRDLPFDQFAIEQLAGDLLPDATLEQKIATGFNRNTQINQEGGIDPEQFRVEAVMDRVATFGTVFLGLTVGCAQCHDHKFDPIQQREYYQLYAFFNSTVQDGHGSGTPGGVLEIPGELESAESVKKELQETRADLERYLDTKGSIVTKWEESLTDEQRAKLKANVKAAVSRLGTSATWSRNARCMRRSRRTTPNSSRAT
ncbi:MAG: DUF1549 domain-containing protein [Acidobacteriota bacterium]|nr:DUF1549 domain-containing protein [Acidobacteriota bacterium]